MRLGNLVFNFRDYQMARIYPCRSASEEKIYRLVWLNFLASPDSSLFCFNIKSSDYNSRNITSIESCIFPIAITHGCIVFRKPTVISVNKNNRAHAVDSWKYLLPSCSSRYPR